MKAGVAINPHTSVQLREDIHQRYRPSCVMSVNPEAAMDMKFIDNTYDKVARLKDLILRKMQLPSSN